MDRRRLLLFKDTYATILNGSNQYWGADDSLTHNLNFERTDKFSIVIRLRKMANGTQANVLTKFNFVTTEHRGWYLIFVNTNQLQLALSNDDSPQNRLYVRSVETFTDTKWHLIVATYDGSSTPDGVGLYADGVKLTNTTIQNSLTGTIVGTAPLNIGAFLNDATGGTEMIIGELQIISGIALSSDQVAMISNNNLLSAYSGGTIVAWYNWKNQGYDLSGSGNTLTQVGSPGIIKLT